MGHGAWGIGDWALGIGHWALEEYLTFLRTAIELVKHSYKTIARCKNSREEPKTRVRSDRTSPLTLRNNPKAVA